MQSGRKAIVPIHGTTCDYIEDTNIDGTLFRFIDTAGFDKLTKPRKYRYRTHFEKIQATVVLLMLMPPARITLMTDQYTQIKG